jgi:hypothetical protein
VTHACCMRSVVLCVGVSAATFLVWSVSLGADSNDQYSAGQVAGLVLPLVAIGVALPWLARGFDLVAAATSAAIGISGACWASWSDDSTGLFVVGWFMVTVGTFAGTAVLVAVGFAVSSSFEPGNRLSSLRRMSTGAAITGPPSALLALGLVIVLTLLTAEESHDLDAGPLVIDGEGPYIVCVTSGGSSDFTNGSNVLRYDGEEPLTISKVDFADGQGLTISEALVVPVGQSLVGSWAEWPPPAAASALGDAIPAEGAVMSKAGVSEYNLVLHLTRSGVKPVDAGLIRLFYEVGDQGWGTIAPVSLQVEANRGSCPK